MRVLSRRDLRRYATVPVEEALARWAEALSVPSGPAAPLDAVLDDWGRHTGLDREALMRRIATADAALAQEFERRRPTTPAEVAQLYRETETLIPLLARWHGSDPNPARCAAGAAAVLSVIEARKVLDFGCGIGSTALVLGHAGLDVTLADVAEGPVRLAAWRMERRALHPTIVEPGTQTLPNVDTGSCDGIVAFDVLEHVPDLDPVLAELDRALAPTGVLCLNQVYVGADEGPQHYPQCGEALLWLHERGYRLAHVTGVCWVAQRASLPGATRGLQAVGLRSRMLAARGSARLPRAVRQRLVSRALR